MKKIYYYVQLSNISPLHIGNGKNDDTDMDVLMDSNSVFYIPGTSFAGVCYHQLSKEQKQLFNPEFRVNNEKQNKKSPVFFSDAYMKDKTLVETRDGIHLNENKTTEDGAKYNYQIIPSGAHFDLRIEVCDYDDKDCYEELIESLLRSIQNHDITMGYKTTRGLGVFEVIKCMKRIFTKENFKDYFAFDSFDINQYDAELEIEKVVSNKCVVIQSVLEQCGGISIRTYNTMKGVADYTHIHSANKPVIPGSSWNGLIRKQFHEYAKKLGLYNLVNDVFGTIEDGIARKSRIFIEESVISGGYEVEQMRTKINRFHAGTCDSSLFQEKSHYDGITQLTIRIDATLEDIELVVRIIGYVLDDLNDGFIALGGLTSIGRGIFKEIERTITGLEVNK